MMTMMNSQRKKQGTCSPKMLRFLTGLLGVCLAGYIVGPPLYWHISETLDSHMFCPRCDCIAQPLFSIPKDAGLNFSFFTDCMKHDPAVSEEMEKSVSDILLEEVRQREAEALENQRHTEIALLEAKKIANQYQKHEEKCNSGMETCEDAREKAEDTLEAQRELTEMREMRARQKGWKEVTI